MSVDSIEASFSLPLEWKRGSKIVVLLVFFRRHEARTHCGRPVSSLLLICCIILLSVTQVAEMLRKTKERKSS